MPSLKRKTKKPRIWTKIIIAYIAVYIGISIGFTAFSPYEYSYRQDRWYYHISTILIQPVSEVLADGKVTHFYDWTEISKNKMSNLQGAKLRSKKEKYGEENKDISWKNFLKQFGKVEEAAIINPQNYDGQWSLIFCTENGEICKQSNILHKGSIKILVDGNDTIWGIDKNDNIIPVVIEKYTDRDSAKHILFI